MAFKTIKRPKISLGERFYLQSILGGLWITIKHLVLALLGKSRNKKELAGSGIGVTMQYRNSGGTSTCRNTTAGLPSW